MTRRRFARGIVAVVLGLPVLLIGYRAVGNFAAEARIEALEELLRTNPTLSELTAYLERRGLIHSVDRRTHTINVSIPVPGWVFGGAKGYTIRYGDDERVTSFTADYEWDGL